MSVDWPEREDGDYHQWWDETSSGSGAKDFAGTSDDYDVHTSFAMMYDGMHADDEEEESYAYANMAQSMASELKPGELFNHKVPPAFDGNGSWFAYEEMVMDWLDLTSLDAEKQGIAVKLRLVGGAAIFQKSLFALSTKLRMA